MVYTVHVHISFSLYYLYIPSSTPRTYMTAPRIRRYLYELRRHGKCRSSQQKKLWVFSIRSYAICVHDMSSSCRRKGPHSQSVCMYLQLEGQATGCMQAIIMPSGFLRIGQWTSIPAAIENYRACIYVLKQYQWPALIHSRGGCIWNNWLHRRSMN